LLHPDQGIRECVMHSCMTRNCNAEGADSIGKVNALAVAGAGIY
jgi:hypothetical protein